MSKFTSVAFIGFTIVAGAISTVRAASTHAYPERPVRIIVTTAPGGAADFTARLIGQALGTALGQTVVVDNRRGTGGIVALTVAARSEPDGYTLVQNTLTTHAIGVHLYSSKTPYDPIKDFASIIHTTTVPLIMVINSAVAASSVKELIALAKTKRDFKFAGPFGSGPHLTGELFKSAVGVDLLFVPYVGSAPAVLDVAAGRVEIMFDGAPALLAQIKSGRLRPLAAASAKRNPLLPDLPTFAELGHKGLESGLWYGLLALAKTPKSIVRKLNTETNRILAMPEIRERFAAHGSEVVGGSPEQFEEFMRTEAARWGRVIKEAKIKVN